MATGPVVRISVNGDVWGAVILPKGYDPLAYIAQCVEEDLGKCCGEDTALDPGEKIEYTYNEWTVTVERKEL